MNVLLSSLAACGLLAASGAILVVYPDHHQTPTAITVQVHTVDWFKANQLIMREQLMRCNNDPGSAPFNANCENAAAAKTALDAAAFADRFKQ